MYMIRVIECFSCAVTHRSFLYFQQIIYVGVVYTIASCIVPFYSLSANDSCRDLYTCIQLYNIMDIVFHETIVCNQLTSEMIHHHGVSLSEQQTAGLLICHGHSRIYLCLLLHNKPNTMTHR